MLDTIREHAPQLRAAEEARFSAYVASCSLDSQLQVACASEASLPEEFSQLQADKTLRGSSVR